MIRRPTGSGARRPAPIREPRLRPWPVLARGALFGALALVPTVVLALLLPRHGDRLTFLAVIAGMSFVVAACFLPFGAFYVLCSRGDLRRCRDWRTLTGRYDGVTVMGPVMLRLGGLAVVLGVGALLAYGVL